MKNDYPKKGNKACLLKRSLAFILSCAIAVPLLVPENTQKRVEKTVHAATENVTYGDVNSDGKISILDMISLKSYITEKNTKGFSVKAADLDGDGTVSAKDAVELSMFLLNQTGSFSYEINIDTDGDGLCDYVEKEITKTDYMKKDTDGDGLDDYSEVYLCDTDPLNTDTGKTGVKDAMKDSDGDKLTNAEEIQLGTSPTLTDTDEDGLSDYDEVKKYKTNPLKEDTDGDGISDNGEIKLELDPLNVKSDGKTSDAERAFEQKLNSNSIRLSENNSYSLDVWVKSTGYIEDVLEVSTSRYSDFLAEDEILGDIVDVKFSEYHNLLDLKLSFTLKNISTPKNYMIFKYNNDATMLLPVFTNYDGNSLTVNDIEDGTYCIVNINDMSDNMLSDIEYENNNNNNISLSSVLYNSGANAYFDMAYVANNYESVNLIYEICINNNCKVPSWNEISSAIIETNNSLVKKGYNVSTKFIFTIYGYSVDITCSNMNELKNICNVVTGFFNDSSITTLDAAYKVYQKNRNDKLDVWKDFSNYYSANTNIAAQSNFANNNIVFVINPGYTLGGKYCNFNISGVKCCVYNAYFSLYKKMFVNEIKNNANGTPSDIMCSLILYVLNIENKIPIMRTLFGKILVDQNSNDVVNNAELNYSKRTTLGKVSSTSLLSTKGNEQFQSFLSTKTSNQINLNDMEIIPMKSDPSRLDSDGDGIVDSEDNAPLEKGIYNDNKELVIGELTLLSCGGESAFELLHDYVFGGPLSTGHAFILYKSYIKDSLDLSNFNSGYDYCNSDNPERNYNPSSYSIDPQKYISIGSGGIYLDDAQSAVYNMEFFKGYSYKPNSYIMTDINSSEWDKLLDAVSSQAEKKYSLINHNCAHVAIYLWNHSVSKDWNPFNNVHLIGIDTPTSLYNYLSQKDDSSNDLSVDKLWR